MRDPDPVASPLSVHWHLVLVAASLAVATSGLAEPPTARLVLRPEGDASQLTSPRGQAGPEVRCSHARGLAGVLSAGKLEFLVGLEDGLPVTCTVTAPGYLASSLSIPMEATPDEAVLVDLRRVEQVEAPPLLAALEGSSFIVAWPSDATDLSELAWAESETAVTRLADGSTHLELPVPRARRDSWTVRVGSGRGSACTMRLPAEIGESEEGSVWACDSEVASQGTRTTGESGRRSSGTRARSVVVAAELPLELARRSLSWLATWPDSRLSSALRETVLGDVWEVGSPPPHDPGSWAPGSLFASFDEKARCMSIDPWGTSPLPPDPAALNCRLACGLVVSACGGSVANALVEARPPPSEIAPSEIAPSAQSESAQSETAQSARRDYTDQKGRFCLGVLPEGGGGWSVAVSAPGFQDLGGGVAAVLGRGQRIVLEPEMHVRGRLQHAGLEQAGHLAPVEQSLRLVPVYEATSQGQLAEAHALEVEPAPLDGAFQVRLASRGLVGFDLDSPRFARKRIVLPTVPCASRADIGTIELMPGVWLAGLVLEDDSQRPLEGVRVVARRGAVRDATTDADGAFRIGPLGVGSVLLEASKPGYSVVPSRDVVQARVLPSGHADPADLTMFLQSSALLRLHVSDSRGAPVSGAPVAVEESRTGRWRMASTGGDGWAELADIEPGATTVHWLSTCETEAAPLEAGEETELRRTLPDIQLVGVVRSSGRTVPALVTLGCGSILVQNQSEAEGFGTRFAVGGLTPGEVNLEVWAALGDRDERISAFRPTSIVIAPDAGPIVQQDLELDSPYRGEEESEERVLIPGLVVDATTGQPAGSWDILNSGHAWLRSDASGVFEAEFPGDGRYTLVVRGGRSRETEHLGLNSLMPLGVRIEDGRLVEPEGGALRVEVDVRARTVLRVVAIDGTPLQGVSARSIDLAQGKPGWESLTDGRGLVSVVAPSPGLHAILLTDESSFVRIVDGVLASSNDEPVTVRIDASGALAVRVPSGAPLQVLARGDQSQVVLGDGAWPLPDRLMRRESLDDGDRVLLRGLPLGPVRLRSGDDESDCLVLQLDPLECQVP